MNKNVIKQRLNLVLNYLSLLIILVIFYAIKNSDISRSFLLLEIVPIVLLVWSFINVFSKTGFWKLAHPHKSELDERELLLVYKATSMSYGIFSTVTLLVIYCYAIFLKGPIDVVLAAALLYIAHTLPAAILACKKMLI